MLLKAVEMASDHKLVKVNNNEVDKVKGESPRGESEGILMTGRAAYKNLITINRSLT